MPIPILFIQGAGEAVHDRWDNHLVDSLRHQLGDGYTVHYPPIPDEADPSYRAWKPAVLAALAALPDGAILIGHSVGGTILLHVLANERPKLKPRALILIAAPFVGEGGWPAGDMPPLGDLPPGLPVRLYHGTEDMTVPSIHADLYANALPQTALRRLPHRDHQLNNDLSEIATDIRLLT